MHIHKRNWEYPKQTIEGLFYIKNHSNDDSEFQQPTPGNDKSAI